MGQIKPWQIVLIVVAVAVCGVSVGMTMFGAERIKLGDRIEMADVVTRRGRVRCRVMISRQVKRNVIWMPFHFAEAKTNYLTTDAGDAVTGTGEYKVCAARIEPLPDQEAKQVFPGAYAAASV